MNLEVIFWGWGAGGGIYVGEAALTVSGSSFQNNLAHGGYGLDGTKSQSESPSGGGGGNGSGRAS